MICLNTNEVEIRKVTSISKRQKSLQLKDVYSFEQRPVTSLGRHGGEEYPVRGPKTHL